MRLAIMGCGAVGGSVAELAGEYGHTVTAIADSQSAAIDPDGVLIEHVLAEKRETGTLGNDATEDVLTAAYDVLVETTPTTLGDAEPGYSNAVSALSQDHNVVLANKGPVAERYDELCEHADESDGQLLFDATVGGAIPVLGTIGDLGSDNVTGVRGVLNGTANFILSRMATEGLDYDHVLAEAQDLGVAETDPTFDVDGTDAALKCVILANVLFDGGYTLSDATVTGIQEIPGPALQIAREDGRTIRLIGEVAEGSVRVGPRLVPDNGTLAVPGTQNIVQIDTEHAGRLNISGHGAGGPETAAAIFADIARLSKF